METSICRYFLTKRGCKFEDDCKFLHQMPPCAFFNSPAGCNRMNCRYAHTNDNDIFNVVKQCPNTGCENYCMGKQCETCHKKMRQFKTCPKCGHTGYDDEEEEDKSEHKE